MPQVATDWGYLYRRPTADEIRRLQDSHGFEAVTERWWYLGDRTLMKIRDGEIGDSKRGATMLAWYDDEKAA